MTRGETTIDVMIGETTMDKMIGETIIDKIKDGITTETNIGQFMEGTINRDIEIEVEVGRILEIIIEIIQEKDMREVEIEVEIGVEKDKLDQDQECYHMIERIGQDQNLDLDSIQE